MTVGNHTLPAEMLSTCDGLMYCLASWAYNVTNGFFWTAILLGFCVVLAMSTQRFGSARSFGFASVAGMLGAVWFGTMQLMPWWVASAFILAGATGFAVMIINEK